MALAYDAPSNELVVELEEVRSDAAALAAVFDHLNAPLPENFPKQAVIEIAGALRQLPDGTARGCLRPLTEAQAQLAAVRSQHIMHDAGIQPNQEAPPLFRGEPVDQRLRALMSSVSTALQTANRLAAEELEPEASEAGIAPPQDAPATALIEKAAQTQKELDAERRELDSINAPESVHADSLRRRLTDALILNGLGRGELRMRRIVSGRLRRIGSALREYPALLQQAAELISRGANVADYGYDKWHALKERIFKAGTATLRELGSDLMGYARRLEATRPRIDIAPRAKDPPEDFDLEHAATMIHGGTAPPPAWRPFIEMLPLRNRRLRTLAGLEGLTSLRSFRQASVNVRDLTPLSGLTSLERLDLYGISTDDLRPLSGLSSLEYLSLERTGVHDLTPLSGLTSLKDVSLGRTQVRDLGPLSGLSALEILGLDHAQVSDLAPLSRLSSLQTLSLDRTQVSDLSPLSRLSSLEHLSLDGTQVSDLSPLSRLSSLEHLSLSDTAVTDLAPLAGLLSLRELYLNGTKVRDLTPLAGLLSLRSLHLKATQVFDLTPLAGLTSLLFLRLSATPVSDLKALSNLSALGWLYVDDTRVRDLTPLVGLSSLRHVYARKSSVTAIPKSLRKIVRKR